MTLYSIRMELARNPGAPEGDSNHGYDLIAPLDSAGKLDKAAYAGVKERCVVRHFAGGHQEKGHLVEGSEGWRFDYRKGDADDEPVFRLDMHAFKVGEYVSVTEHDGVMRTFKVVAVDKLA